MNVPCRELATAMELVGKSSMEAAATSVIRMRMQREKASSIPMPLISAMRSKLAPFLSLIPDLVVT